MGEPDVRARLIVAPLPEAGGHAEISGDEAAHARARRVRAGDAVLLLDGSGREALAIVRRIGRRLSVAVESVRESADPREPEILLAAAGLRQERLAWLAEKATELGVTRFVVAATDRAQSFRSDPARTSRLERVVRAAAKQAQRGRWPSVEGRTLREILSGAPAVALLLDDAGEPFPASLPLAPAAIAVGPEGGWTGEERLLARELGWRLIRLPAGKLRAETAAVVALALLRAARSNG
ncbi:MAG TPA: RsmE family RNA methyltransferase [Thermoanaerobaculia bacterium]